jgi:multicomponent Na+:H+ antiporter subunit E
MPLNTMMTPLLGLLGRFLLFWALWWLLTDGHADALVFGLCCAAVAALLPLPAAESDGGAQAGPVAGQGADRRTDPLGPSLLPTVLRLPLLVPFFLWESLRGGADVALRALRPRLPLSPAIIQHRLRLPPGPAPVMMASLVSLMPGTLAIISGHRLRVHVLDDGRDYRAELGRLEAKVARVFGVALAPPQAPAPAPGPVGSARTDGTVGEDL